jgi:hypothetical protein
VRGIVQQVAVSSTATKVTGETPTTLSTSAFGMETGRQDAADMSNVSFGLGIAMPVTILPPGTDGAVDSQVVNWKGDNSPFFWAKSDDTNQSLTSEVTSISFSSTDGSEIPVNNLTDPIVVVLSIAGGTECPPNTTRDGSPTDEIEFPTGACIPQTYNCSYYDDASAQFVVDGVELNRTNTTLTCGFYHLTDLAAVAGPAPQFNAPDFDKMLSSDFLFNNPVGFAIGCVLFILLIWAFWYAISGHLKEVSEEGFDVNNADVMQSEFALYFTNYKVDTSPAGRGNISLLDRISIKLRMDWDWGGLVYPMPGDPNTRAQRCLVLLAATLFTLLFEILFFKDPSTAVSFCEEVSERFRWIPLQHCLFTPELQ